MMRHHIISHYDSLLLLFGLFSPAHLLLNQFSSFSLKTELMYLSKLLQILAKNGTDMGAIEVWHALKKRTDEGSLTGTITSQQQDLSKLIIIRNNLSNDLSHCAEGTFTSSIEGSSEIDEPFPDLK